MTEIVRCSLSEIVEDLAKLETDCIGLCIDQKIEELYPNFVQSLESKLSAKKKSVYRYSYKAEEENKSIQAFTSAVDFFISSGMHRKGHLVAIGGGITSDLAGFVASSLLRGVNWSVVPTTLLSMIDAAIGGKVGVNSQYGKNLIGSFHLPEKIYISTPFLETLDPLDLMSGKGELLKYAFLSQDIEQMIGNEKNFEEIIFACAQFKNDLVEKDFKETNLRMVLNLGHTFGHALEKVCQIPHGIAVFWGMYLKFELFSKGQEVEKLKNFARKIKFKVDDEFPWQNFSQKEKDDFYNYLARDKKKISASEIKIILPEEDVEQGRANGRVKIKSYPLKELKNRFEKIYEKYN